jgi:TRAP-type mannitol/chloroaromatic compound transport system permease small subunit
MRRFLLAVDRLSTRLGHLFAWLIVALTALITWEVLSRKFFDNPHAWVFDAQIMMYGVMFMMAGAYTLAAKGHVRGDVLYGFFHPRVQATIDLILYIVFFIPGIAALVWAGWRFFLESLAIRERSSIMSEGPLIYPFKFFIPAAGALILLQGVAEIIRCIVCLKDGQWPSREQDVEEVDVDALKEMVHVSDADAAILAERERGAAPGDPREKKKETRP